MSGLYAVTEGWNLQNTLSGKRVAHNNPEFENIWRFEFNC